MPMVVSCILRQILRRQRTLELGTQFIIQAILLLWLTVVPGQAARRLPEPILESPLPHSTTEP